MIAALLLAVAMPSDKMVTAVAVTESRMDHAAVGDGGRAISAWQIWPSAWEDANRFRSLNGLRPIPRTADPQLARQLASWLLALHMDRLRKAGLPHPSPQQVYLSYAMGFDGFRRIGFNPSRAPAHKQRALVRLKESLK
jgi:hypothetical protein